jgi:hypothetical protein
MNKSSYTVLDAAASLRIPDDLDLFPAVKAQLAQRRTFMQTLRARPALALMLTVLALLLLTGVAYAIGRSLGYLPGIGFVEPGAELRVLAETVSQRREGVTVTIEQVVVDVERTVILYKAEGLSLAAANSKGEGAPLGSTHSLRLPDGTLLAEAPLLGYDGTPEPLINDLTTEGGWPNYIWRLVFPPVASEVNEVTLVIPVLQNMPTGAAPENWEITFHLKPAPPDMTFAPILEMTPHAEHAVTGTPLMEVTGPAPLSNISTLNGVTLSLDNVIEVENGFVFTGKLTWDASKFPGGSIIALAPAEFFTLSEENGQTVPIEEVPLGGTYDYEREKPWSFRTDRKNFAGPLIFSIPSLKGMYTPPPFEFDLDLGPNPQLGQTWELNREFVSNGQTFRLVSAQLVDFNGSDSCLEFKLENVEMTFVEDLSPNPVYIGCTGEGRKESHTSPFYIKFGYQNIPSGLHRFSLKATLPLVLPGPWQVTWEPPLSSEPTATAVPEVCLTLDEWNQAVGRNDPLSPGLGGKILLSVYDPGSNANFPTLQLTHPDGSGLRTVAQGGWSTISSDGTRLTYTNQTGLNLLDLSTGQSSVLSDDGYHGIWSPDNTRVMYTNTFNLFVVNADGSGLQTIDTGASQVNTPVGWLPDNQTIIYSAMGGEGFTFRRHNLQSGERQDLFTAQSKAGFGSLSPDGQWILLTDRPFGAVMPGIYITRIDGSERKQVADPEIPASFISIWGPDGQWLVLNTYDRNNPDGNPIPVFVNPFTCEVLHLNAIRGSVEGWSP